MDIGYIGINSEFLARILYFYYLLVYFFRWTKKPFKRSW